MRTESHRHHFVKRAGLTAYKCECGVFYGKSRVDGWIIKDYRLPRPTISHGRAIWHHLVALFGGAK